MENLINNSGGFISRWRASSKKSSEKLVHGGWLELTTESLQFFPNKIGPVSDGMRWCARLRNIRRMKSGSKRSRAAVFTDGLVEYINIEAEVDGSNLTVLVLVRNSREVKRVIEKAIENAL